MNRISSVRKTYTVRFAVRWAVFALCILMCVVKPSQLKVLEGLNFFKDFTILHILWIIWMFDLILQTVPVKKSISIGSQKNFGYRSEPVDGAVDRKELRRYIISSTRRASIIFVVWTALIAGIGILHHMHILNNGALFLITAFFYVCDLICVLIWCPFRLILKNECCTTCRIFNWDHMMMFAPLIFIKGFFTWSLAAMAAIVWIVWEICIFLHPERFWEGSNKALRCSECTDKLCIQYCERRLW